MEHTLGQFVDYTCNSQYINTDYYMYIYIEVSYIDKRSCNEYIYQCWNSTLKPTLIGDLVSSSHFLINKSFNVKCNCSFRPRIMAYAVFVPRWCPCRHDHAGTGDGDNSITPRRPFCKVIVFQAHTHISIDTVWSNQLLTELCVDWTLTFRLIIVR